MRSLPRRSDAQGKSLADHGRGRAQRRRRRPGGRAGQARGEPAPGHDLRRQPRDAPEGQAALQRRKSPASAAGSRQAPPGPPGWLSRTAGSRAKRGGRSSRSSAPKSPRFTSGWVRTPIDAFILAELEQHGLKPSPEADRRTLIRRLSFDLIGLPPTPEEIEAFVQDPNPERLRSTRRPPARQPPLRRALGPALARRRPLRRHSRLRQGQAPRQRLALSRLRDRRVQPRPSVRPVHPRAGRRRRALARAIRRA